MRPPVQQAQELIIPVFSQWERVGSVTAILAELTQGYFYDAALLMDQALRDDRVRSAWNLRLQAVLGLPAHMEASTVGARRDATGKTAPSKKAAAIADEAMELWPTMAPLGELYELLLWGENLGAGVARKNWLDERGKLLTEDNPAGDSWVPQLQTWHGGAIRFDLMSSTYRLRTYDQGEILIERGDPNWTLFTPWGSKYGRLRGLLVSLVMLWLDRQWTFRDRARHSEVYGQPVRVGITPLDADEREKDKFRRFLASPGTENALIAPQGEREKWDVRLLEAQANAHQTFSTHLDHVDRAISMLYLGQSESMEGKAGLGSQEKAGDQVMRYVMRFVAKNISDIAADLLGDWAEYNHGNRLLAPRFCIEVDPPEEGTQKATELSTLGDAVDKLEAHGVDVRKLLEETGVPMLSPEEAAQKAGELEEKAREQQQQSATGNQPPKPR